MESHNLRSLEQTWNLEEEEEDWVAASHYLEWTLIFPVCSRPRN